MNRTPCQICGNHTDNKIHIVRERMMFGFRDEFDYMECQSCGCLQLKNIPENMNKYYPENYGSFQSEKEHDESLLLSYFRKKVAEYCLGRKNFWGRLFVKSIGRPESKTFGNPDFFEFLRKCEVDYDSDILEVGCGTGYFLLTLEKYGFENLTGVDLFIKGNIFYNCGVKVFKSTLYDMDQQFDFIMLNHCFEHMPRPLAVLKKLNSLLKNERYVIIRIPVMGSFAWRQYGTNWAQIDAPRHLFLHTIKSMEILAGQSGFKIIAIEFDSTDFQFWASEKYRNDISMISDNCSHNCSKEQIKSYRIKAQELNKKDDGDMAAFIY